MVNSLFIRLYYARCSFSDSSYGIWSKLFGLVVISEILNTSFNHPFISITFAQTPLPTIRISSHYQQIETLLGVYRGTLEESPLYHRDGYIRYESHFNLLRFVIYQEDGTEDTFLTIPHFMMSQYLEAQMSSLSLLLIPRFSLMLEILYEASVTYLDPLLIIKSFEFQLPAISQQYTYVITSTNEAIACKTGFLFL